MSKEIPLISHGFADYDFFIVNYLFVSELTQRSEQPISWKCSRLIESGAVGLWVGHSHPCVLCYMAAITGNTMEVCSSDTGRGTKFSQRIQKVKGNFRLPNKQPTVSLKYFVFLGLCIALPLVLLTIEDYLRVIQQCVTVDAALSFVN